MSCWQATPSADGPAWPLTACCCWCWLACRRAAIDAHLIVCHTCAGDEAESVVAVLRVLPEVDVAVVEDVCGHIDVVEGLGREHHAHIITCSRHSSLALQTHSAKAAMSGFITEW